MSEPATPGAGNVFYVVDLSGWAHRCHHAMPPAFTASGEPCHVTRGVIRMLVRLLRRQSPAFLAIAVDEGGPTWRHELFPKYKAHRPPQPEALTQQIGRIQQVLRLHRIPLLGAQGFEADDCIAAATSVARASELRVVIVAQDKDLQQLVADDVVLWDGDKRVIDAKAVRAKWDVGPEQLGDLLALVGDTSDGVPGVPGIGQKTAAELLTRRGSLTEILRAPDFAKTPTARAALRRGADTARLSRELVGLRVDAPIELDLSEARVGNFDIERLRAAYIDLGLLDLAEVITWRPKRWLNGAPRRLVDRGDT